MTNQKTSAIIFSTRKTGRAIKAEAYNNPKKGKSSSYIGENERKCPELLHILNVVMMKLHTIYQVNLLVARGLVCS